jgi:hypothetical protein
MAECTQAQLIDFAQKNNSAITQTVGLILAKVNPWASIFKASTWQGGLATVHRVVVGRDAAPANPQSIVAPSFTAIEQMCTPALDEDKVGTTSFDVILEEFVGRGPGVCLNLGFNAFQKSFDLAVDSITKLVKDITVADNRYQALALSGIKVVTDSATGFYDRITGDEFALATPFAPGVTPDGVPTFKEVKRIAQYLTTDLGAETFSQDMKADGTPIGANIKVIAGEEVLDKFRDQLGVKESYYYLAAGGFKYANEVIQSYDFEGPYQGIGFASDPQPLRLNTIPVDGVITEADLIAPKIPAGADNGGTINKHNPAYSKAKYELLFMIIGPDSFERQIPSRMTKLGTKGISFPDAIAPGEIKFFVPQGACDGLQRVGQHWYSIQRAIEPHKPHYIAAVLFKRCNASDLSYCDTSL